MCLIPVKPGKILYIDSSKNSRNTLHRLWKAGQPLEVYIQQNQKLMEIWVPTQEKHHQQIQEQIKNLCHNGKKAGLSVAVFLSGDEALQELTSALLTCNQEKAAARQEKKDGLRQV